MSDESAQPDGLIAGRFRVLGLLGSGATASVYEAVDAAGGARVAVKVLHPHLAERPALRAAFLREAEIVAGVQHPSLCAVVGSGTGDTAEAQTWTAWQLAPGLTLGEHVRERGVLSAGAAVEVANRVLAALAALHAAGLVHRDVSPSNVVIDVDAAGQVRDARVIDFGLVDVAGSHTRGADVLRSDEVTTGGGVIGNVQYAAPEQLRGEGVGPAADLYQLAGVLYFALVGAPPFARGSTDAVIRAHQSATPPIASVRAAAVPVALDRAIVRAMLKDPRARFASADEMRAALASAVTARAVTASAPVVQTSRTRVIPAPRPIGENPDAASPADDVYRSGTAWLWGLGLVAAVLVVAVVLALTSSRPSTIASDIPAPVASSSAPTPTAEASAPASTPPAPVPDAVTPPIEGLAEDAARSLLAEAGLAVGEVRVQDSARPPGTVLRSDPAPGTTLARGALVALTLASGSNVVPQVVGAFEGEAVAAVAAAGLVASVSGQPSALPPGTVLSAQPGASAIVPLGTAVVLAVAVAVPVATATPTPTPAPTPTRTPTPAATQ